MGNTMRIAENEKFELSFLQKEVKFDADNGMIIKSDKKVKSYIKTSNSDSFFPVKKELPPIEVLITSVILELVTDDEEDFVSDDDLVSYVDMLENPDCKIIWPTSHVLNPECGMLHCSASIVLPKIVRGLPCEIELKQQDGLTMIISKSTAQFKLSDVKFDCYHLNSMIDYYARVRIKLEGKTTEWSNWLKFKPDKKRSLGRTF